MHTERKNKIHHFPGKDYIFIFKFNKKQNSPLPNISQARTTSSTRRIPSSSAWTSWTGASKVGTPICVPEAGNLVIGKITSIEKEHKAVNEARKGAAVCIKIEPNASQKHITLGRHFSTENTLVSRITRKSIDILKENYKDEITKEDIKLLVDLKKMFDIK